VKPAARKRLAQVLWTILFFGPPLILVGSGVASFLSNLGTGPSPKEYNERVAPQHCEALSTALNVYFGRYGAYPPELYGGPKRWKDRNNRRVTTPSPDPFLREGIIRSYPRNDLLRNTTPSGFDPRFDPYSKYTIHNLVSSPNDIVVQHYMAVLTEWIDHYKERATEDQYRECLENAVSFLRNGGRMQAAGGIRGASDSGEEGLGYSITPLRLSRLLWHDVRFCSAPRIMEGNFGYTRGEHVGNSETNALLWIYGSLPDREQHFGLDLLNAETGELKPDGIPDGICILYELKDGEVVNVTLAEDM
jgi:hypothetical protein